MSNLVFVNPDNNYTVTHTCPWLWSLLFGIFYFIYVGAWTHAVIGLILALITGGLSWLVYPFFAKKILINNYLNKGWVQV